MFEQAIDFLKESKNEIWKVVFPGRQEVIGATTVVIISVILASLFLAGVDYCVSLLMKAII
jgi:preprotein translocase SecE subunit